MHHLTRDIKKLLLVVDCCGLLVTCMACLRHTLSGLVIKLICQLLIACGQFVLYIFFSNVSVSNIFMSETVVLNV